MSKLFEETSIATMKLRNRIVMAAMHLGYAEDGFVNDRLIRYYEECARGEVGLIVVGGFGVHRLGGGGAGFLSIEDDKYILKMKELTETLQRYGSKVACQLYHAGRYAFSGLVGGQSVSASAVPSKLTRETPRELSVEEIKETAQYFGDAARRAKEAGFDAVEIIGSTGYLISQFLSPLSNTRTDEYGGSIENRARFGADVVQAVREMVGADFPIIMRHSGAELMEGGNTIEDSRAFAKEFEKAGVDAISVQVGWHESRVPTVAPVVPRGAFVFLAEGIKKEVSVPVMTCNRINDPRLAEQIIAQGRADFVAMARALNADPAFPLKAREGQYDDIIPCIGCNEGCLDMVFTGGAVTCLLNPRRGREAEFEIDPADRPKRVMIAGGGPAGMEAARVAALRGHEVDLYDKAEKLGGRFVLAHLPPGREELGLVVKYLSHQVEKVGVNVHMRTEINADLVEREQPDAVVLATGGVPILPDMPGIDRDNVVLAEDALAGMVEVGQKVVIIGAGGVACETALYLAKQGAADAQTAVFLASTGTLDPEAATALTSKGQRSVTVVRRGRNIGETLGRSTRWIILRELRKMGARMITEAQYEEITDEGLVISVKDKKVTLEADTIVIAAGFGPDDRLKSELEGTVAELHVIGDAKQSGKAVEAIYDGSLIGRQL